MINISLTFPNEEVQELIHDVKAAVGVELTEEQITKLFEKNVQVAWLLHYWGITDTESFSQFINVLCKEVGMNSEWPTYRDGDEHHDRYFKEFIEKAKTAGYKITYKEKIK